MLTTARLDPTEAIYFHKALNDSDELRVITWPRFAGKSTLMGMETERLSARPNTHILIVHPNADEALDFKALWLDHLDSECYTNCEYVKLPSLVDEIANTEGLKHLYIYFSEPDYYTEHEWGDPYSVLVSCLHDFHAVPHLCLRQVTYIGTPMNDLSLQGFTLTRISGAVELAHSAHPREMYADWAAFVQSFGRAFSEKWVQTRLFGEV